MGIRPRSRADQAITERRLIATNLKRRMAELGLTNPALGRLTDTDPSLISNIRNAKANPTLHTLVKIAHALDWRLIDLLSRNRVDDSNR